MKWRLRFAIPLVILALVAVTTQVYAQVAGAQSLALFGRPRQAHAVKFPPRQSSLGASGASAPQGSGDLIYGNGPVQLSPAAYVIFWGPQWMNGSSLTADGAVVDNYFKDMGHTSFANILSQYYSSSGGTSTHISPQLTYGGYWIDTSAPPTPDTSCAGAPTVHDSAIQAEVNAAITGGHFPSDSANAAYFVYTPSGDYVNDDSGGCSELQFCAYHGFSNTVGVSYAAMAYPNDMNACGAPASPNGNAQGDSLANITSHEQFESITDPNTSTGWIDSTGDEIGDKCAWDFSAGTTSLNNSGAFELQTEYSNASHSCINAFAGPVTANPTVVSVTAASGANPAPQTVTITNNGVGPYSWQASTPTSATWIAVSPTSGTLNPQTSQPLTLTISLPANASGSYSTTLSVTDQNGFVPTIHIPVTVVVTSISKVWYFAEGHTGNSFTEYLTLENPNSSSTNVSVEYLLSGGSPITKGYTLAANTRSTIIVNNEVGAPQDVSMVVTASQPIVAERPMYFTYAGHIPGGSDVLGATQLTSSFDFGYLDTSPGASTWLTILNQNSYAIDVRVRYFAAASGAETDTLHTVAANSRGTINVNAEGLPAGSYSALVSLTQSGSNTPAPGLVERPLYLIDSLTGYTGSADIVGVSQPLSNWYFAEGYTGPTFSERYILSNPSTTSAVSASVTFLLSNGSSASSAVNLAPGAQQVINANAIIGAKQNNSAVVTSTGGPVLAERFMSFEYTGGVGGGGSVPGGIQGASDVLGAAQPSQVFEFAEGYTGGQFAEFLTLENPGAQAAQVTVRYLPQSGATPTVITYTVPANSRYTVVTNAAMPSQSFSMEVISSAPIVAERPMYFVYNVGSGPQSGGTDVIGYEA